MVAADEDTGGESTGAPAAPQWRIIGKTVEGASHKRSGLPNQDAILWKPDDGKTLPIILAISDGHGSEKSFRSHLGARTAVKVALEQLSPLAEEGIDLANLSGIKRIAEERLPRAIADAWRAAVLAHHAQHPFHADEWARLQEKKRDEAASARRAIEANPAIAYGATLLAVVVTESFILYLQLGDGDILAVPETGTITRPMAEDARLFANETTSLSSDSAWRDFRVSFQALAGPPPALIMVSTDGYANSFKDDANFLQAGYDYLNMIRDQGIERVERDLPAILEEASQRGSGDDITLGIIKRGEDIDKDTMDRLIFRLQAEVRDKVGLSDMSAALRNEEQMRAALNSDFRQALEEETRSRAAENQRLQSTMRSELRREIQATEASIAEQGERIQEAERRFAAPAREIAGLRGALNTLRAMVYALGGLAVTALLLSMFLLIRPTPTPTLLPTPTSVPPTITLVAPTATEQVQPPPTVTVPVVLPPPTDVPIPTEETGESPTVAPSTGTPESTATESPTAEPTNTPEATPEETTTAEARGPSGDETSTPEP
jgi:flagellum-specific peptidoglycan hydrolase FlgJ